MVDIDICGIHFDNPIVPASGCFGFGLEMTENYDLNILGGIALKGTTKDARFGNPCPRIAECKSGMINSVGLQNPGIESLIKNIVPLLREHYYGPVIANISGFSIEEYVECALMANECEGIDIIELNISCPNVHNGGMAFGTDPKMAYEVTKAVVSSLHSRHCERNEVECGNLKPKDQKPIFVKLSPNVTDIVSIAKACEEAGADGLCLINTLLGMRIDIKKRKPIIANTMGGYSGPGIFPIALRMIYQVHKECKLPIIGCGGVTSAEDLIEMMMAGASIVEIGAENLRNPFICKEIIEELPNTMTRLGINNLKDIIGII